MEQELQKLREENEALKKMNGVKSDIISISAHQLRTSLSALKWILKMFLDKDLGEITAEQRSFMEKAYMSNERMIAVVSDVLTLNHAEDSSLKYKFELVDIVHLIDETLFDFVGESYKRQVEIVFAKPSENIETLCDKEKIRVVLQNLIENGLKYSEAKDKIFISIAKDETGVTVSVRDTGIGIPSEEQDKIFEKFFRAKNAQEKELIGSGLGLFTTQKIVNDHHGKIWLESTLGEGSTFSFTLPKNPETAGVQK